MLQPEVEDFLKSASGDNYGPILNARRWQAPFPLQVYDLPSSMVGITPVTSGLSYTLDRPGDVMVSHHPSGVRIINMAFLRLVGASQGEGVAFFIPGVYERDETNWIASAILEAGNVFCKKYVYPMIITVNHVIQVPEQSTGAEVI